MPTSAPKDEEKPRTRCEIYTRVCGFLSPVSHWNKGKKAEFRDRQTFDGKREVGS